MNLSQIPLACGVRYGVSNSLMPVLTTTAESRLAYLLSRSRIKYFGPSPQGVASRSCCAVHSSVGYFVTPVCIYPPRFQFHHHKDIPLPKQPVVYNCKITCPDVARLIFQKSRPILTRRTRFLVLRHVSLDGSFTYFYPQLHLFSTDPFRSP